MVVLHVSCADPESFVRGGSTQLSVISLADDGKEDTISIKIGPSMARQRNAV